MFEIETKKELRLLFHEWCMNLEPMCEREDMEHLQAALSTTSKISEHRASIYSDMKYSDIFKREYTKSNFFQNIEKGQINPTYQDCLRIFRYHIG